MKPVVSLKSVVEAMDVFSDEFHAYINKCTGEIVTTNDDEIRIAESDEDIEDYPEWQRDAILKAQEVIYSDEYLQLPGKFDIHEYAIMERFCISIADEKLSNKLLYQIRGSGAFRRFKDAIYEYGIADDWYKYRQAALEKIAIEWLEENSISYTQE